jgi:hypothetical protein
VEVLKGREERQKDRPRQVSFYRASLPHTYHACNKSAKTEGPEGGIETKGLGFRDSTCTQHFTQYAEVYLKGQGFFMRKYTHICAHEHACIHMHNAHARSRYLRTPPSMQPHIHKQLKTKNLSMHAYTCIYAHALSRYLHTLHYTKNSKKKINKEKNTFMKPHMQTALPCTPASLTHSRSVPLAFSLCLSLSSLSVSVVNNGPFLICCPCKEMKK